MGIKERKSREKNSRVQSILDAARAVFFEKGFQNASMEEIASQAEIGKGTIYLYFKNKTDLYTSILVDSLENFNKRLIAIGNDLESGRLSTTEAFLNAFFRLNYEAYNANPDSIFFQNYQLNKLLLNLSKENLDRLNEAGRENLRISRQIVAKAVEKNLLPDLDPVKVIDVFRAVVLGSIQLAESRKIFGQKCHLEENLKFAFSLLTKAFEALSSTPSLAAPQQPGVASAG